MSTAAPPRVRANPVLGSALELRRSQVGTYERVMREVGDVVRLAVGPPGLRFDLFCVFHPDAVKVVLASSRDAYSKGNRFISRSRKPSAGGLLPAARGGLGRYAAARRWRASTMASCSKARAIRAISSLPAPSSAAT